MENEIWMPLSQAFHNSAISERVDAVLFGKVLVHDSSASDAVPVDIALGFSSNPRFCKFDASARGILLSLEGCSLANDFVSKFSDVLNALSRVDETCLKQVAPKEFELTNSALIGGHKIVQDILAWKQSHKISSMTNSHQQKCQGTSPAGAAAVLGRVGLQGEGEEEREHHQKQLSFNRDATPFTPRFEPPTLTSQKLSLSHLAKPFVPTLPVSAKPFVPTQPPPTAGAFFQPSAAAAAVVAPRQRSPQKKKIAAKPGIEPPAIEISESVKPSRRQKRLAAAERRKENEKTKENEEKSKREEVEGNNKPRSFADALRSPPKQRPPPQEIQPEPEKKTLRREGSNSRPARSSSKPQQTQQPEPESSVFGKRLRSNQESNSIPVDSHTDAQTTLPKREQGTKVPQTAREKQQQQPYSKPLKSFPGSRGSQLSTPSQNDYVADAWGPLPSNTPQTISKNRNFKNSAAIIASWSDQDIGGQTSEEGEDSENDEQKIATKTLDGRNLAKSGRGYESERPVLAWGDEPTESEPEFSKPTVLSYLDALKSKRQSSGLPKILEKPKVEGSNLGAETEEGKKKKRRKKKKGSGEPQPQKVKRSAIPLTIDFAAMIAQASSAAAAAPQKESNKSEKHKFAQQQRLLTAGGGGGSSSKLVSKTAAASSRGGGITSAAKKRNPNAMDSNPSLRRRGKERATPRTKKLTTLKKTIIRELLLLQQQKKAAEQVGQKVEPQKQKLAPEPSDSEKESEGEFPISVEDVQNEMIFLDGEGRECPVDLQMHDEINKEFLSGGIQPPTASEAASGATTEPRCEIGKEKAPSSSVLSLPPDVNPFEIPGSKLPRKMNRVPWLNGPREYCDQALSPDLDSVVTTLISTLNKFQVRAREKDPIKAKMRRRIVVGLRETLKGCLSKRAKCVILAPNIEKISAQGGLDSFVYKILDTCRLHEIPVIYALSMRKLGRAFGKSVRVSCMAVYSADGAFEEYRKMLQMASKLKEEWRKKKEAAESEVQLAQEQGEKDND